MTPGTTKAVLTFVGIAALIIWLSLDFRSGRGIFAGMGYVPKDLLPKLYDKRDKIQGDIRRAEVDQSNSNTAFSRVNGQYTKWSDAYADCEGNTVIYCQTRYGLPLAGIADMVAYWQPLYDKALDTKTKAKEQVESLKRQLQNIENQIAGLEFIMAEQSEGGETA